jgi:hypothetical protein
MWTDFMKTLSLLATAVVLFSMTMPPALAQVPGLVDGTQNNSQSFGGGQLNGGGYQQYNMQTQVPSQMGQMQQMQNMQAFGQMPVPGNGMMNGFDMTGGGGMNASGAPQQAMSAATQGNLSPLQSPNLSSMSPYDQQEQALEETKMMSQLEELKQKRENDESFRTLSGQADEKQARKMAKFDKSFDNGGGGGNGGPGMIKGLASGMGKVVRGTMGVALPAGAIAGQYFLLKSAMGGGGMGMGGGRMMMMPGSTLMMMGR